MVDETASHCALAACVILAALNDVKGGRTCDSRCKGGVHWCAGAALDFLGSAGCETILEALGVDFGQFTQVLPSLLPELQSFRQQKLHPPPPPRGPPMTAEERRERERARAKRKRRALRSRGLDSKRRPLTRTCYNCRQIRQASTGDLVCRLARTSSGRRWDMIRRVGCEVWAVRLEWEIEVMENEEEENKSQRASGIAKTA